MSCELPALSLTMQLPIPEAEQEWHAEFAESLEGHDLIATWMLFVLMLNFSLRGATSYFYICIEIFILLALLYLQAPSRRRIFASNRVRIIRTLSFLSHVTKIGFPIEHSDRFVWTFGAAWWLLSKAFAVVVQSFGFRAHMRQQIFLMAISTIVLLKLSTNRCEIMCNENYKYYNEGHFSFLAFLAPSEYFSFFARKMLDVLDPHACRRNCDIAGAYVTLMGSTISTLIISVFEETSRLKVLTRWGGCPIFNSSKTTLFFCVLLFPFWHAIILDLSYAVNILVHDVLIYS